MQITVRCLALLVLILCVFPIQTGCTPKPAIHSSITEGTTHGELLWAFQVDRKYRAHDRVRVIICHRTGDPPCLRLDAKDITALGEYAHWRYAAEQRELRARTAKAPRVKKAVSPPVKKTVAPSAEAKPEPEE